MRSAQHLRLAAVSSALSLAAGCTISVKTPSVADYERLHAIDSDGATREQIEIDLGSPQGTGIHRIDGEDFALDFYYGMVGTLTYFPSQKAAVDSGMAFVSYASDGTLKHLVYFTSRQDGPPVEFGEDLPIKEIAEAIELGKSNANAAYDLLGEPSYRGRRLSPSEGIEHQTLFYDVSEAQTQGAMKERWLIVGIDPSGVVKDLAWVSSYDGDLESASEVEPQTLQTFSRLDQAGMLAYWQPSSIATDTQLDPVRVHALLRTQPPHIDAFVEALGKPNARGFKYFAEQEPWVLSNWSSMSIDVGERQSRYVPPSLRDDPESKPKSYMVMDVEQARLMVAHTQEGEVKEVIWFAPSVSP